VVIRLETVIATEGDTPDTHTQKRDDMEYILVKKKKTSDK